MKLNATAISTILLLTGCFNNVAAEDGPWLERQIRNARDGAVILVPAGDYNIADVKIFSSLILRGDPQGKTIFHSSAVTDKGLLIPQKGVSLTVEDITFRDTVSWDRNGAGIRHEGLNLTILNCIFDGNEDGVLSTGDKAGIISIKSSAFIDNGFGDGQSHGIYVFEAARLQIADSRFVGNRIGHHVKSLANETIIENSHFDDANGRTSYALDVSRGGAVTLTGNTIIQSVDSDNQAIVNYDLTRGGSAVSLRIENNKIINRYAGGILLRNATRMAPVISGNEIVNEGRGKLAITSLGSPKPQSAPAAAE